MTGSKPLRQGSSSGDQGSLSTPTFDDSQLWSSLVNEEAWLEDNHQTDLNISDKPDLITATGLLPTAKAQQPSPRSQYSANTSIDTSSLNPSSLYDTEPLDVNFVPMLPLNETTQADAYDKSLATIVNDDPPQRCGIEPSDREELNERVMPSMDELAKQREIEESKTHVQNWLNGKVLVLPDASKNLLTPHELSRNLHRRVEPSTDSRVNAAAKGQVYPFATGFEAYTQDQIPSDSGEDDEDDNEAVAVLPPTKISRDNNIDLELNAPNGSSKKKDELYNCRPWVDSPVILDSQGKAQPDSSDAAISRFHKQAKDTETASVTATLGSRRRSLGDLESIFSAAGISVHVPRGTAGVNKDDSERRPRFYDSFLPKRSNSSTKKRSQDLSSQDLHHSGGSTNHSRKESQSSLTTVKRFGEWARPKSPRVDTNISSHSPSQSPPSATTLAPSGLMTTLRRARSRSDFSGKSDSEATSYAGPHSPSTSTSLAPSGFMTALRGGRNRSRSDISMDSNLAEMWARQGGPPLPTLKAPTQDREDLSQTPTLQPDTGRTFRDHDDDDDSANEAISMVIDVNQVPASATMDAFAAHVKTLNPRLPEFMIDRITTEQLKRYKRLMEIKLKHELAVQAGDCFNTDRCIGLDGAPIYPFLQMSHNLDTAIVAFHIPQNMTDQDVAAESTSIPATFPEGIPIPPVQRLPAEFECPLCFQVKKINKPSDWTKHVHEDVQPFTCTFPNCSEPKSFKRKADWVRHENERHRHLERWVCESNECQHVCFRKDNFVQHLVREHKHPEPRVRSSRLTANGNFHANDDQGIVAMLVNRCRVETSKRPNEEPCRFCDITCNDWKKLTGHLGKHMEQISMPVLQMIHHEIQNDDWSTAIVHEQSKTDVPARFDSRTNLEAPEMKAQHSSSTMTSQYSPSPVMIQQPQHSSAKLFAAHNPMGQTYPPAQISRSQSGYSNGLNATNSLGFYYTNPQQSPYQQGLSVVPQPPYSSKINTPADEAFQTNQNFNATQLRYLNHQQHTVQNSGLDLAANQGNFNAFTYPPTSQPATSQALNANIQASMGWQEPTMYSDSPVDGVTSAPFSVNDYNQAAAVYMPGHDYYSMSQSLQYATNPNVLSNAPGEDLSTNNFVQAHEAERIKYSANGAHPRQGTTYPPQTNGMSYSSTYVRDAFNPNSSYHSYAAQ